MEYFKVILSNLRYISTMKIKKLVENDQNIAIYNVYDIIDSKEENVASFELDLSQDEYYLYLEHICRDRRFKGRGYLPKVLNWIFDTFKPEQIVTLPLRQYRAYYESLGFKVYKTISKDDIYYVKERTNV